MVARSLRRALVIAALVLAGGLAAAAPARAADALVAVGDELAVGKNRTGETCRLRLVESRTDLGGYTRYSLFCEGWTQPSGEIRRFGVAQGYTVDRLLTDSNYEKSFSTRLGGCGAVEPTTLSPALGTSAVAALRDCRRLDGDFRAIVVGAIIGRRGYGVETFPTNLPVLEAAVEVLEGKRAPADADKASGALSGLIRRAETMVDASGKLTRVGDVGAHAVLYRLGTLRNYAGDYAGSEEAFRRALEIEERTSPGQPSSGRTMCWIALNVGYQFRFEESEQLFDRAEPLVKKGFTANDQPLCLAHRGNVEHARGRDNVALPYSEEAVRLRDQRGGAETTGLAHALVSLGRVQLGLKRLDEAERSVTRSLQIVEKPGQDMEFRAWWVGESNEWLGRIHMEQKRWADARKALEAALARRRLLFGDSITVANSYRDLGQLGVAEGNRAAALQAFRKEAEIRATDPVAQSRARPSTMVPYLNALFDAAAADPAQRAALHAEAFAASQIPREGDTARAIVNMAARLDAADATLGAAAREYQEALRRRDTTRRELALLTLAPPEKRDPAREEQLKQELQSAEKTVAARESKLQADFPRYAGLVAPRPLPLAELTALLKPGEALVSFVPTRDATYVFLVRDGKVSAHRAAVPYGTLDRTVRGLRQGLDLADGQVHTFDVAAAHRLYTDLLAPVAPGLERATHLIVVPAGPLLSLPLGLLVTQAGTAPAGPPEKADYRQVAFLGRQAPISVLPSTGSLKSLRAVAGRSKAGQPFIGFGDPAFGGAPGDTRNLTALGSLCRDGNAVDVELVRGLPRLRDTAGELRQIAQALNAPESDVILGAEATEKRVRGSDLSRYRVVAFATHGLLPGELKCKSEPALALTPPAAATADEDGLLDAGEVAQLKLDADWVVLSACNTAAPDGQLGGQSLSGLARAFFYAGARALLVSHWAVATQPTVVLTTTLFDAYGKNPALGRAAALRTAQLKLMGDAATSHPSFWAPFVLVGDGGTP
ncbi:MAG TPA: CHAT domain-containing tetratricopeptide repeat protein [Candidatus Bathyarchaeia archaeon]|nr:CHAT domain-containing tetratricopeptide repeat protein [Candidatus Bathyarchaeia archaeon]